MITTLIAGMITFFLVAIFHFIPVVTIATIPYIGTSVASTLTTFMGIWNSFMVTFPYAQTAWDIFTKVIIPFELLLLVVKIFFGSRTPAQTHSHT